MLATIRSFALRGIDAIPIIVEVDVMKGLPTFSIVGLPDTAVQEAKERVKSAIRNSGFAFPNQRIVINLAPADLRKQSSGFDLPMAIGILVASKQINTTQDLSQMILVGELALHGGLRSVRGIVSMAIDHLRSSKVMICPMEQCKEVSFSTHSLLVRCSTLQHVVRFIEQGERESCSLEASESMQTPTYPDFSEIKGQAEAKLALEIAAAGSHNVLMNGPPGTGKTLLAQALLGILPPLDQKAQLEVMQMYSAVSKLSEVTTCRPFRAVHHTASRTAITGGGRALLPGEMSLAHEGVLFFDELPEFDRQTLEVLRQPLEDHTITIARAHGSVKYPAKFMFVASQNPCPCGYYLDADKECRCSDYAVERYQQKISGPLRDRIDVFMQVERVSTACLLSHERSEASQDVKQRVIVARKRQHARQQKENALLTLEETLQVSELSASTYAQFEDLMNQLKLSGRGVLRTLRLARTIADLRNQDVVGLPEILQASFYRNKPN